MATIAKFYLLDAVSPNTGIMPSNDPSVIGGGPLGAGSSAAGAATARDATDVAGTSNPDLEATCTAEAAATSQILGLRRFVSRPLAAQTFAPGDGNWTFDWAAFDSNTNHAGAGDGTRCDIYCWRPSTGAQVGTGIAPIGLSGTLSTTEAHFSAVSTFGPSTTIQDGDILVFDVFTNFTQGMAVAYTESFSYNGTTEGSITTCASFVTPPSPLTLFVPAPPAVPGPPSLAFM